MNFLLSELGAEPVVLEGLFPAPTARVYRAWTDPDQLLAWFGPEPGSLVSAEVDLRPGGDWRFVMTENAQGRTILEGEYLEIRPEERLSFSWRFVREDAGGAREETATSKVIVRFEAEGEATRVSLRHEDIELDDGRRGVGEGWTACLENLVALLAA